MMLRTTSYVVGLSTPSVLAFRILPEELESCNALSFFKVFAFDKFLMMYFEHYCGIEGRYIEVNALILYFNESLSVL